MIAMYCVSYILPVFFHSRETSIRCFTREIGILGRDKSAANGVRGVPGPPVKGWEHAFPRFFM